MVQLFESDIHTKEVLAWRGLHILHGRTSSCSQKLRIFLNLKGIEWQSHELNLAESENYSDWFLGINPRGLVPVLVDDGAVTIESNDIIALLEQKYPSPQLIPPHYREDVAGLLNHEDELHLDLRTLSFRFVFARTVSNKTPEMMRRYKAGTRTVEGHADRDKQAHEIDFYEALEAQGIPDTAVAASARKFRAAFDDLETRLADAPYFLGPQFSILDIAWFVYASRLNFAGYPFERLHPRVSAWHQALAEDDRLTREITLPPAVLQQLQKNQADWARRGTTLADISGL